MRNPIVPAVVQAAYDRQTCENALRANAADLAADFAARGVWLKRLKACCAHGEWYESLDRLGISPSTASRHMRLADDPKSLTVSDFARAEVGGGEKISESAAPPPAQPELYAPKVPPAPAPAAAPAPSVPATAPQASSAASDAPLCSRCTRAQRVGQTPPRDCKDCRALRVQARQDQPAPWEPQPFAHVPPAGTVPEADDPYQDLQPGDDVRPRDPAGVVIPDHVRQAFEMRRLLADECQRFMEVHDAFESLKDAPGGRLLPVDDLCPVMVGLKDRAMAAPVPDYVCPHCGAAKADCPLCLGHGWVDAATYKSIA